MGHQNSAAVDNALSDMIGREMAGQTDAMARIRCGLAFGSAQPMSVPVRCNDLDWLVTQVEHALPTTDWGALVGKMPG